MSPNAVYMKPYWSDISLLLSSHVQHYYVGQSVASASYMGNPTF
jgi:hypothetical protein